MRWIIPNVLAGASRPGYNGSYIPIHRAIVQDVVQDWCESASDVGIKSIICLLPIEQLSLYTWLPTNLS